MRPVTALTWVPLLAGTWGAASLLMWGAMTEAGTLAVILYMISVLTGLFACVVTLGAMLDMRGKL